MSCNYVDYGGSIMLRQPYIANGVAFFAFAVRADRNALQQICDRRLNEPSHHQVNFAPAGGFAFLVTAVQNGTGCDVALRTRLGEIGVVGLRSFFFRACPSHASARVSCWVPAAVAVSGMGRRSNSQSGSKQVQTQHEAIGRPFGLRQCAAISAAGGDQGCPNLDAQGVFAGAHEALHFEILLERLEKQLDLPAVLIDGGNGRGAKRDQVGQQHDLPLVHRIPDHYTPQQARAIFLGLDAGEADQLVRPNVAILGSRQVPPPLRTPHFPSGG